MERLERAIERHLRRLSAEIGLRPAGSRANQEAEEYIRSVFGSAGLTVEKQEVACPDWSADETWLEMDGKRLPVAANPFSPPCDLVAPLAPVGSLAELRDADLTGRVALLYGDLTSSALIPPWITIYNDERDLEINRLLDAKRPAAIVTVSPGLGSTVPVIEDMRFPFSSATVPAEVGLKLLAREGAPAGLRVVSRRSESRAANVVGTREGSRAELLVFCAHFDTKFGTSGAVDNAAGVAVVLALAETLPGMNLDLSLEFVCFADHEYFMLGSEEYLSRGAGRMGEMAAALNFDGAGYRLGPGTVAIFSNSEPFQASVDELLRERPGFRWTEPWPQSDHSLFAWRGVPSLAFSSPGLEAVSHRPQDTIEWVSPSKLAEVASIATSIARNLDGRPAGWTRPT